MEGDWTKTLTGENFLLHDDGDSNKILIFGMQENLLKLSELDIIYVHGTFSTCPSLFHQLFTINGFVDGQQFPLVCRFLPTKSRADYNRFFTIMKEEMQNRGLIFATFCRDARPSTHINTSFLYSYIVSDNYTVILVQIQKVLDIMTIRHYGIRPCGKTPHVQRTKCEKCEKEGKAYALC